MFEGQAAGKRRAEEGEQVPLKCQGTHNGKPDEASRPNTPDPEKASRCLQPNMMDAVLTRLRDFTRKAATFDACTVKGAPPSRLDCPRNGVAAGEENKLDIESALAWLRRELVSLGNVHRSNQHLLKLLFMTYC